MGEVPDAGAERAVRSAAGTWVDLQTAAWRDVSVAAQVPVDLPGFVAERVGRTQIVGLPKLSGPVRQLILREAVAAEAQVRTTRHPQRDSKPGQAAPTAEPETVDQNRERAKHRTTCSTRGVLKTWPRSGREFPKTGRPHPDQLIWRAKPDRMDEIAARSPRAGGSEDQGTDFRNFLPPKNL